MAVTVTHSTIATLPDEPGAEINKAEWNDDHSVVGLGTAAEANTGDFEAAGAVNAHEALPDPHPGYLTPAEGDAAYPPLAHDHTGAGEGLVPEAGLDVNNAPIDRGLLSWDAAAGKLEWATSTEYAATSLNVVTGTILLGDVTSIQTANDANYLEVQEVVGVPGHDTRITFENVETFNRLRALTFATEGSSHLQEIRIYNVGTTVFDLFHTFGTQLGFTAISLSIDNGADYIDPANSDRVIVQIYHPLTGVTSHRMRLDWLVLLDDLTGGGGITHHQGMDGREEAGSHPAFAVSNSPAGTIEAINVQAAINELDGDVVAHKADAGNPHATSKAQVGLATVTDDAQLKRAAGDFSTFTEKAVPIGTDVLLLEDSAAGGAKKFVQITNLPSSGGGVSAVSGTAPIVSSGGAAPDISIDDFVASGASHARGAVPDPGASPGTTRFLREDATFAVPAGSGSGTDEVLLVPTSNKQIPANSSLLVADYYRLESGIALTIESGSNLTII